MKIPKNFPEWLLYHKRFLIYFLIQLLFVVIVINYKPKVQAAENVIPTIMRLDTTVNKIFDVLTILAKNDSIMAVQLKHFPTSPPISLHEMTAVSSVYSSRDNPITHKKEFHCGVDYRAKRGTVVLAAADGVVFKAKREGNYGNLIAINHLNGYETTYAHLNTILVKVDQQVTKGDTIGTVGNTGMSTGDHLHFEIAYLDKKINPEQFYPF